jgi:orotidine 5'-phosphate decarboxylase subfamily 1
MREYAIILAADVPDARDVISLIREVGGIVDGIKVAAATLLQSGTDILRRIREIVEGKPILVDLKIADIGFRGKQSWDGTNAKIINAIKNTGATHVTVHGFPGPSSIAEAAESARAAGIAVLLLPLMSHAGAGLFFSRPVDSENVIQSSAETGLSLPFPNGMSCNDITEAILILGEALEVDGYIGPATRPHDLLRYRSITQRPIWCPGFGRQDRLGRGLKDQFIQWANIVGPKSAAIVGSTIFGASDPVAAAREVIEIRDSIIQ